MAPVPPPSSLKAANNLPADPCFPQDILPRELISTCLQYLPNGDLNYLAFRNSHHPEITVILTGRQKNALDLVKNEMEAVYTWIQTASGILSETQNVVRDALQQLVTQRAALPDVIAQPKIQLLTIKRKLLRICKDLPQDVINNFSDSNLKCLLLFQRTFNDALERNEDHTKMAPPIVGLLKANEFELAMDLFKLSPAAHKPALDPIMRDAIREMRTQLSQYLSFGNDFFILSNDSISLNQKRVEIMIDQWQQTEDLILRILDTLEINHHTQELCYVKFQMVSQLDKFINLLLTYLTDKNAEFKRHTGAPRTPEEAIEDQFVIDKAHINGAIYDGLYKILKKLDRESFNCVLMLKKIVSLYSFIGQYRKAIDITIDYYSDNEIFMMRHNFEIIIEKAVDRNEFPKLIKLFPSSYTDSTLGAMVLALAHQQKFDEAVQIAQDISGKRELFLNNIIIECLKANNLDKAHAIFDLLEDQNVKNVALEYIVDHFLQPANLNLSQAEEAATSIVFMSPTHPESKTLIKVARAHLSRTSSDLSHFDAAKRLAEKVQGNNFKTEIWSEIAKAYLQRAFFGREELVEEAKIVAALYISDEAKKNELLLEIVSHLAGRDIIQAERYVEEILDIPTRDAAYKRIIDFYLHRRDAANIKRLFQLVSDADRRRGYIQETLRIALEAEYLDEAVHIANEFQPRFNDGNFLIIDVVEAFVKKNRISEARTIAMSPSQSPYHHTMSLIHILKTFSTNSSNLPQILEILTSANRLHFCIVDWIKTLPLGLDKDSIINVALEKLQWIVWHEDGREACNQLEKMRTTAQVRPQPPSPPVVAPVVRPAPPKVSPLRKVVNKIISFTSYLFAKFKELFFLPSYVLQSLCIKLFNGIDSFRTRLLKRSSS